jgi:hypothetical protein
VHARAWTHEVLATGSVPVTKGTAVAQGTEGQRKFHEREKQAASTVLPQYVTAPFLHARTVVG